MAEDTARTWLDEMRAAVQALADDSWTAAQADDFWDHAERAPVRLAIYGALDAGKSTLLKRLLVEDGTPIPGWLTISGRVATVERNEIASGALNYIDTPGIASGDTRHEKAADDALATVDAAIIALTPQLMTTGREHLLSIISGEFFNPANPAPLPSGALLLVIAKADMAGPDPALDLDDYQELRERKRAELTRLLAHWLPGTPVPPIHVVIADLHADVNTKRHPRRLDYDKGRDYDGIAALRSALHALVPRQPELSAAARIRYWCLLGSSATRAVDETLSRLEASAAEAARQHAHLELLKTRLAAMDENARTSLQSVVRDELWHIAEAAPSSGIEEIVNEADRRLDSTIGGWLARWSSELSGLARSASQEITLRAERPSAAAYRDFIEEALRNARSPSARVLAPGTVNALVVNAAGWIPHVSRALYKASTGMSPSETHVIRRLQALQNRSTPDHSHLWLADLAEMAPQLVQLGSIIVNEMHQRRLSQREQDRRKTLRADIEEAGEKIAQGILDGTPTEPGWNNAVTEFRTILDQSGPPGSLITELRQQHEALSNRMAALRELLEHPGTASA
jgi:50S ribosome-binding GTPase